MWEWGTRQEEERALRTLIEESLQGLQVKAFYYELAYRLLCEVGLERLGVQAEEYFLENIQAHLQLLSSELVVLLTFLYDLLLKCSFTEDPAYSPHHTAYENQRVFNSTRLLYSRRSFFAGRSSACEATLLSAKHLQEKLEEFKARDGAGEEAEEGVRLVVQGIKKVEALQKMVREFHDKRYESSEKRYSFQEEQAHVARSL